MVVSTFAFDLDETLASTRKLVERAYLDAGVERPDDYWGLAARQWLPDLVGPERYSEVHDVKNASYARLVQTTPLEEFELPAAQLARELIDLGEKVYVVTSASEFAAHIVLAKLGLRDVELLANVRSIDKPQALTELGEGTYFDDDTLTLLRVMDNAPTWQVVHVTGKTYNELHKVAKL